MTRATIHHPIPKEEALRLCTLIRMENARRWYSWQAWQCWGCVTFTGGNTAKMCFNSQPGFRGCALINTHYDRLRNEQDAEKEKAG
jgi:hypothetical protein